MHELQAWNLCESCPRGHPCASESQGCFPCSEMRVPKFHRPVEWQRLCCLMTILVLRPPPKGQQESGRGTTGPYIPPALSFHGWAISFWLLICLQGPSLGDISPFFGGAQWINCSLIIPSCQSQSELPREEMDFAVDALRRWPDQTPS